MTKLRAGILRKNISIQRKFEHQDDFGNLIYYWAEIKKTRASINPISGNEMIVNNRLISDVDSEIILRFTDVKAKDRIVYNNRIYDIKRALNFENLNVWIQILAKEDESKADASIAVVHNGKVVTHNGSIVLTKGKKVELTDILTYDFNKVKDILDIPDVWTPLNSITLVPNESGIKIYEVGVSINGRFPSISKSIDIRYKIGASNWIEMRREGQDKTDIFSFYYAFPKEVDTIDPISFEVEVKKDSTGVMFDIYYCDVWVERKS